MNQCKHCKNPIIEGIVYCNVKCMTIDYNKHKIKIKCIVCGMEKEHSLSQKEYKYCSQKCYHVTKRGKKRPAHSEFMKGKTFCKGNKLTLEQRDKISGKNSPSWKGGITSLYHKIRRLPEHAKWRLLVYERDKFICQECKKHNLRLECHHIVSLSKIIRDSKITTAKQAINCKELWNIKNGLTLCKSCHKKTDSYGKNTNSSFIGK